MGLLNGFILETEALLAAFAAFLSAAILLSSAARSDASAQQSLEWGKLQLEADSLADFIVMRLAGEKGELMLNAVGEIRRVRTQIVVDGQPFGEEPPSNSSIFSSRRLVRVSGRTVLLEVRKW